MRLLFEKGKQRELLKREKETLGFTWLKFANYLNMKCGKLMTFFIEERLIDDLTFNKLKLKKNYKRFIVKRLNNNWGQSKGGNNSNGRTKEIKIPKKNKELAELWGIMLGDGSLQKLKGYKLGVYGIDIAGHSVDDREYLLGFVKSLCENLFEASSGIYESKRSNCIHVKVYGKKVVDFFEENGFRAGDKIRNQVTIPDWINVNDNFLASCLRGLYDTDGSFYRLTNQDSHQIHFKNLNKTLLNDVRKSLIKLGINPSKIICDKSIVITKKSEIEKFYKVIGFSNPKHLNKINAVLAL
jgi:hypothetical protein